MLNRPSSRRKSHSEGIELNLVPILDTMVTLIGFLLFTTSFLAIVSIDSILPQVSTEELDKKKNEVPLQLTLAINDTAVSIYSYFDKFPRKSIPNTADGKLDFKGIHEFIIDLKKKFVTEENVVLVPKPGTPYETMIELMDIVREMEPTDTPIYRKNPQTGVDEPVKTLFPKVVFADLKEGDK